MAPDSYQRADFRQQYDYSQIAAPNAAFSGYQQYYGGGYDPNAQASYQWSSYQFRRAQFPMPVRRVTQIDPSASFLHAAGGMSILQEEEEDFADDYVKRRAGKQQPRGYESLKKRQE